MGALAAELVDGVCGLAPVGVDEAPLDPHGGPVVAFPFAFEQGGGDGFEAGVDSPFQPGALMDHGEGHAEPRYSVLNGALCAPCVHASGLAVATQTTASWVADLRGGQHRHWVTATAAPCTGLFKPAYVDEPLGLGMASTTEKPDDSLWWRHERLHRAVLRNPKALMPLFVPERDAVEEAWLTNPPESGVAFAEGDRLLSTWTESVRERETNDVRPFWVRRFWSKRTEW